MQAEQLGEEAIPSVVQIFRLFSLICNEIFLEKEAMLNESEEDVDSVRLS